MKAQHGWLVAEACKLAAELSEQIEQEDGAESVEVELRVKCIYPEPEHRIATEIQHIRRVMSNGGEWGGTQRMKLERFV